MTLAKYFSVRKRRSWTFSWWDVLPLPHLSPVLRFGWGVLRKPRSWWHFALRQCFKYSKCFPRISQEQRDTEAAGTGGDFPDTCTISCFAQALLNTLTNSSCTCYVFFWHQWRFPSWPYVQQNLPVTTLRRWNGNHIQMKKDAVQFCVQVSQVCFECIFNFWFYTIQLLPDSLPFLAENSTPTI